ncbi:unnamed protein product [Rhodiola kirilowii]
MEFNHPLWSTTDYHHHHQYHQADIVRSFKCSFCKRGFSNAQALGGHMNIHRKDRAKLRQLSCNNIDNNDDAVEEEEEEHNHNVSSYHRIRRLKRSGNKGIENHHHQLQQQLPLFIEATQWVGHVGNHHDEENYDEDEDLFPELDLELRLGPEPDHHRMAGCLGTRNFF